MQDACEKLHPFYPAIARLLISPLFILAGVNKLMAIPQTGQFFASLGLPGDAWFVVSVGALEALAGLALLVGAWVHEVAYGLIAFTVVATLVAHMNISDQLQMVMFLKNLAIAGGLLVLADRGAGPWSVDAYRTAPTSDTSSGSHEEGQ